MKDSKNAFNYQLFYRRTCLIIYDIASVLIASFFAIALRYEFELDMIPDYFMNTIIRFLPFNIVITLVIFFFLKLKKITRKLKV